MICGLCDSIVDDLPWPRPEVPQEEDATLVSQGPSMRVRAVMKDEAIFVHLRDLIGYVSYPLHDVNRECQDMVTSLLQRLGEALESD